MKNFLSRMNRGVALGLILIAGLGIFFTADAVQFSKEEPVIKDMLTRFLEDAAKVSLLPEPYRDPGAEVPDSVLKDMAESGRKFAEQYFTNFRTSPNEWPLKQSVLDSIGNASSSLHLYNQREGETVQSLTFTLTEIGSIKKQASNAVTVVFTARLALSCTPNAGYFNLIQPVYGNHLFEHNYYDDAENGEVSGGKEIKEYSQEITYSVTLIRTGGEWKIAQGWFSLKGSGRGMYSTVTVG